MKKKATCYLYTLRRAWGLTQEETARLVGAYGRNRVARVEQNVLPPNGGEILAYSLLFGRRPAQIFPTYCEDVEDGLMRAAAELEKKIRKVKTPRADRLRQIIERVGSRATGKGSYAKV